MSCFDGLRVRNDVVLFSWCASAAASLLMLTGCATVPPGKAAEDARALVAERTGADLSAAAAEPAAAAQIAAVSRELTGQPLTMDAAVRLAILHNPRLREQMAALGVAQADLNQAGLIANPILFASARFPDQTGARNNVEFGLSQDVLAILMRPGRTRLASAEFERTRSGIAHALIGVVLDVREKYLAAVGAAELAAVKTQMADAERISRELARRFNEAGNISPSHWAAAEASYLEADLAARRVAAEAGHAREQLQRLLAVPAEDSGWTLREPLPWPPSGDLDIRVLEDRAIDRRLDLAAARSNVTVLEDSLRMTRRWRWTGGVIAVGVSTEQDTDGVRVTGPQIAIGLPLFDRQQSRIAGLEARLQQAREHAAALEVEIRSDVRGAHARLNALRLLVDDYRQRLVPAREEIVRQLQLEQNYMLIGVFEVLAAKRQEFSAREAMIDALRDYWSARLALERAADGGTGVLPALAMATKTAGPADDHADLPDHAGRHQGGDEHGN